MKSFYLWIWNFHEVGGPSGKIMEIPGGGWWSTARPLWNGKYEGVGAQTIKIESLNHSHNNYHRNYMTRIFLQFKPTDWSCRTGVNNYLAFFYHSYVSGTQDPEVTKSLHNVDCTNKLMIPFGDCFLTMSKSSN